MSTMTDIAMLRFTVESEPVETAAVLPARLLVVNCGTDGFNTEVEVEETCNTPGDDIKKHKNKCPNCGKQYYRNKVPRKCAGKITKTVDKWELIRDGFAKSLCSVYDEQVPHLVGFAGFGDGGQCRGQRIYQLFEAVVISQRHDRQYECR